MWSGATLPQWLQAKQVRVEGGGRGGISSYTVHNFNLHHMTRDWRLIKHDNGRGFIVNPWRWRLTGSRHHKGQRMHKKYIYFCLVSPQKCSFTCEERGHGWKGPLEFGVAQIWNEKKKPCLESQFHEISRMNIHHAVPQFAASPVASN